MSSEHKGGVVFDYWVSNPWHGRASLRMSAADETLKSPMTTAAATRREENRGRGDAVENDDISTDVSDHAQSSVYDCSDEDSNNASIPGGDAVAFDDKHNEPESVLPRAAMPGENRRRIIFVEFCTNPDSRIGRLHRQGWT